MFRTMPTILFVSTLTACAAKTADEAELIGRAESAVGLECAATPTPTATFTGHADYTSPQNYSTPYCYKAVVVDINDYDPSYEKMDLGGTQVEWADVHPVTKKECEDAWVFAELFRQFSGSWVKVHGFSVHGRWTSFFEGGPPYCEAPAISFPETVLEGGKTYRIAATARPSESSAAPTRKVRVISSLGSNLEPPR